MLEWLHRIKEFSVKVQVLGRNTRKMRYVKYLLIAICRELRIDRLNIDLTITLDPSLRDDGEVSMIGTEYRMTLNPNGDPTKVGLALAHELTHVKQYARGTLKNLGNNRRSWRGKVYEADTPYLSRPWELQALAQQEILLRRALEA